MFRQHHLFSRHVWGEDGRGLTSSNEGELVFRLNFTDGTSGIFTATIPVPEPSSGLLVLAGLLAAVRYRKRPAKHATAWRRAEAFLADPKRST